VALLAAAAGGSPANAAPAQSSSPPPGSDAAAKPAEAASASPDLHVQQVRPSVHVIVTPTSNVTVWTGNDGVVLVDSGAAAQASELIAAVARLSPNPLRFVVNTQRRADHMGGNEAAARKGAVVIGHDALRELRGRASASAAAAGELPNTSAAARPLLTLTDSIAVHLNGDRLDVLHVADAHSSSDLVARLAAADVVCLGDIFWNGQYPFIDLDDGGSLAGVVAAVEAALARSTTRTVIVPGHGPVATRADLAAYRDMLVGVGRQVREAIEAGQGVDEVLAARPTADYDGKFVRPGAAVSAEDFVRTVYRDLAGPRSPR
jgi:glyoxylase-like metal-dependent hydrolase (beta-lactamase superfamily II)